MDSIQEITEKLIQFRKERDWEQFHRPKKRGAGPPSTRSCEDIGYRYGREDGRQKAVFRRAGDGPTEVLEAAY